MNNIENKIPELNLKVETKTVEAKTGIIRAPYVLVTTPYMILSDKNGTRRVWTINKNKIILYYLYRITKIKWFIKKYNEQSR
jgi:hypothetical protein